ncbi:MAG: acyl-CoA carboxylase subunit epsilon [Acidimicrobiales bacterium]
MPELESDAAPANAVHVRDVRPTPTDEELAAIMAAVEVAWPRPAVAGGTDDQPSRWRFSGRWWSRPLPTRRDRP